MQVQISVVVFDSTSRVASSPWPSPGYAGIDCLRYCGDFDLGVDQTSVRTGRCP